MSRVSRGATTARSFSVRTRMRWWPRATASRACRGADASASPLSRPPQELRSLVPRPRNQRRLRRQGDRHQPHAPDKGRRPLHRRPLGRQVPEDLHLPGGQDARSERNGRRILQPPLRDRAVLGPQGAGGPPRSPLRPAKRGEIAGTRAIGGSARRNRLPTGIALRHVGVIAGGVGAVIPNRAGIGLGVPGIAIIGIVTVVVIVRVAIIPQVGHVDPSDADGNSGAEAAVKRAAVKSVPVERAAVKRAAVKSAPLCSATVKHAAVKPTAASVKAPATTTAVCRVGCRQLERRGSKQQNSYGNCEGPADLPGSITRSLSHRSLLPTGRAAGSKRCPERARFCTSFAPLMCGCRFCGSNKFSVKSVNCYCPSVA